MFPTCMHDLPLYLRAHLPDSVPVRRDRGKGLYVVPAARMDDIHPLTDAGFTVTVRNHMLVLGIGETFARRFAVLGNAGFLSASLAGTEAYVYSDTALTLLNEGIKLLEAPEPNAVAGYDRKVRQTAAVALRKKTGGVYLCAKILETFREI